MEKLARVSCLSKPRRGKGKGTGLLKEASEEVLEALRDEIVVRGRDKRRGFIEALSLCYKIREFPETSWETTRLRIPRIRGSEGVSPFEETNPAAWGGGAALFGFGQG